MKDRYNFKNYHDLEVIILSCLLLQPKNMENLIVEDKHFIKNKALFKFFKTFYKTYGNLDINIMMSVCPNKFKFFPKLNEIITDERRIMVWYFETYQQTLIKLFNEEEENRNKIMKVYDLTNELICRLISVEEYKTKVNEL